MRLWHSLRRSLFGWKPLACKASDCWLLLHCLSNTPKGWKPDQYPCSGGPCYKGRWLFFLEWGGKRVMYIFSVQIKFPFPCTLGSWFKIAKTYKDVATAVITCVFSGLLEAWKEAANAFESSLKAMKCYSNLERLILLLLFPSLSLLWLLSVLLGSLRSCEVFHMACLLDRQSPEGQLANGNLFQCRISLPDWQAAVSRCSLRTLGRSHPQEKRGAISLMRPWEVTAAQMFVP